MDSWNFILLSARSFSLLGPLTRDEVGEALQNRKITFSDMVYTPHKRQKWHRVYEIPELAKLLPESPTPSELSIQEAKILSRQVESVQPPPPIPVGLPRPPGPPPLPSSVSSGHTTSLPRNSSPQLTTNYRSKAGNTDWFLQTGGSEYGPFTTDELNSVLASGKLGGSIFAWKKGMENWVLVQSLSQLIRDSQKSQNEKFQIERGSNKRSEIRVSLVAVISVYIDGVPKAAGVCNDISENGTLLINLLGPQFSVKQKVELLITPVKVSGVHTFRTRALVAWTAENPNRVGFRFQDPITTPNLVAYMKNLRKGFGIKS